jgi:hypothetical protein
VSFVTLPLLFVNHVCELACELVCEFACGHVRVRACFSLADVDPRSKKCLMALLDSHGSLECDDDVARLVESEYAVAGSVLSGSGSYSSSTCPLASTGSGWVTVTDPTVGQVCASAPLCAGSPVSLR